MNEEKKGQSLKEMEAEVLAEGREWTRQRLQQRLQAQAEEGGRGFSPPVAATTSADVAPGGGESDPEGHLPVGSKAEHGNARRGSDGVWGRMRR